MKLIIYFIAGDKLEIVNYKGLHPEKWDYVSGWKSFIMADGKLVYCNPKNMNMVMLVEDNYNPDQDNSWRILR